MNAASRLHGQVDRIVNKLDSEMERDLNKVAQLEEKIFAKPVSFGEAKYDPKSDMWKFRTLVNDTGQLKWKLDVSFRSDATTSGAIVNDGKRTYELIAIAITRWGVLLAFQISDDGQSKSTKLFNKTDPLKNKVFTNIGDKAFQAIDGNLDLELSSATPATGVAAFPLFVNSNSEMFIEFNFKSGPKRLKLPLMSESAFTSARNNPSLTDMLRSKFAERTHQVRSEADRTKAQIEESLKPGNGWFILIILAVIFLMVISMA